MFAELNDLYQTTILDHSKSPRNFRKLEDADRLGEGNNPLCGDRFQVALKLNQDVISDIGFQGSGCAISKAAASVMTEAVKGKTISEAQRLSDSYHKMVKTGRSDENKMDALAAFAVVHKYPMRVKCAVLPWNALAAALKADGPDAPRDIKPTK